MLHMNNPVGKWLNYKYPQNYIIRNPVTGTLIIALFVFGFTVLYKPFNTHASGAFSFEATMALYSFLSGFLLYLSIRILKTFKSFSNSNDWTILKEIVSAFIILFVLGIAIYLLGFFIETSGKRWNISTFLNSVKGAFLIGIIPLAYFTAINYRLLFWQNVNYNDENIEASASQNQPVENLIQIRSQLKNEELNFYPDQFLYAESDGNYVVFYLNRNNLIKKETIRNSINNIEQQLSDIPYIFRTHRAFIVNLKKVRSKQGNTLGYQIKLSDTEFKIPVSRNNTKIFNKLLVQYHK